MKKLFESFRRFALLTEEQLLVENRIKKVEKIYPELAKKREEFDGESLLDVLIQSDPTEDKKQKYLQGAARILKNKMDLDEGYGYKPFWGQDSSLMAPEPGDDMYSPWDLATKVAGEVQRYHDLKKFLEDDEKDLMAIKTYAKLHGIVGKAYNKKMNVELKHRQDTEERETAYEESDILITNKKDPITKKSDPLGKDFFMVRPLTHAASCYWGKDAGAKYCISQKDSNYFNQFTGEGRSFFFLWMANQSNFLKENWGTDKRIVLEYLDEKLVQAHDNNNKQIGVDAALNIIRTNLFGWKLVAAYEEYTRYEDLRMLEEKDPENYKILIDAGLKRENDVEYWWKEMLRPDWDHVQTVIQESIERHPAGPQIEEFKAKIEKYNLDHFDVEVQKQGDYFYWRAAMAFDFDDLKWAKEGNFQKHFYEGVDFQENFETEVKRVLDDNGIEVDFAELDATDNKLKVKYEREDEEQYYRDEEESDYKLFDQFLGNLQNYDLAYKATHVDLVDLFIEFDLIDLSDSPYGQFRQRAKAEGYENFDADTSGGTVDYYTEMTLNVPEIGEIVQALTKGMSASTNKHGQVDPESEYYEALQVLNKEFNDVFKPIGPTNHQFATNMLLDALSKHFLEVSTGGRRQLNLPGIPVKEMRQLITPAKFKLKWATLNISEKKIVTKLGIVYNKDDSPVQMKALEEFLDYFDKNYDVFIRIVHDLMVKILWSAAEETAKSMKKSKEPLPGLEGLRDRDDEGIGMTVHGGEDYPEARRAGLRPFTEMIAEHTEPYQRKVRKRHRKMKIRLIGKGGQKNTAPYSKKPPMKRSKSAPPAE